MTQKIALGEIEKGSTPNGRIADLCAWARRAANILFIFREQHTSKAHCGNDCDLCKLLAELDTGEDE